MIKRKIKFTHSIDFSDFELGEKAKLMQNFNPPPAGKKVKSPLNPPSGGSEKNTEHPIQRYYAPHDVISSPAPDLHGDSKILYEAYSEFSKAGMTIDHKAALGKIDEVLKDASIQLTKDGGAIITDSNGRSTKVPSR